MNIDPLTLLALPVLLFAIVVHETAHALVAFWGGDDTASLQGRITLDPMAHIDPVGTVLMPIIGIMTGFPLIGWAKPVPVNPLRLKNSTWDVYVSIAGPISNLLQALLAFIILFVIFRIWPNAEPYHPFFRGVEFTVPSGILGMLVWGIWVNVALAFFNMIPLPPLDGHWVVSHFFLRPGNWLDNLYSAIQPYSYMILMGLFIVFGQYFGLFVYVITILALRLVLI